MRRISIKGVIIGGITDIASTLILTLPVVIYVMVSSGVFRLPKEKAQAALSALVYDNMRVFGVLVLIGIGCSVLGGYIAARIAKHDELLNGLLSSIFCVAIGIYSVLTGKGSGSLPVHALITVVSALSGLLGGYLRLRQVRVRANPT